MLRCAVLKRVSKNSTLSCRKFPPYQRSLIERLCHQIRPLGGFLPIVSSHDSPKKEPSCNTGLGPGAEHKTTSGTDHGTMDDTVNQHEIPSDKNVGESLKKPQLSEDESIVSSARAGDVTGSANMSGEHLLKDEQSPKRRPQSASKSAACSTESDKLDKDNGEKAVAVLSSNKKEQAHHATSKGDQGSRNEHSTRKKDHNLHVSATLPDGTLVIPSFKLCQDMEKGIGKSFSFILRIISQWRAQARDDLKHEYHRKPSLVYVFPEASESSFDIEVFRKEPDWFEQPMTRYKLYHTLATVGCLYIDYRPLPETVFNRHKLDSWKNILLNNFRCSLKNHIGVVDRAGILRRSKQPSTDQFLYELKTPTNLYLSAGNEVVDSPKERYVPPNPTNTRQAEKTHEKAQKISMSNQIETVMRLAGDLYDVSTMLNEEISNAPSQTDGSLACNQVNPNWRNEPNPVLETRKNGQIDIDAVKRAISRLRVRLRNQKDKAHILAHLCKRWKEELEIEYPLMKRDSVSRSGIHNLAMPPSGSSRTKSPVAEEKTPTKPQGPAISTKMRYYQSDNKRHDDDDGFSISPF